jgi:hypothetical protein
MPTLQKETQQCSVIFTRENRDRVYILTRKCYRVWHTHLQKTLHVYNLQGTIFCDGKKTRCKMMRVYI